MSKRVHVKCPQCGTAVAVARDQVRRSVTCDNCLEEFVPLAVAKRELASKEASGSKKSRPRAGSSSGRQSDPEKASRPKKTPRPADAPRPPVEEERIRVDGLADDEYPERQSPILESDYEFTIRCPLCATLQDATDTQIGGKAQCPDCHSQFSIQEPPPRRRRPVGSASNEEDEEIRLSPLVDRPKVSPILTPVGTPTDENTETPTPPEDPKLPSATPGADALRKAEADLEHERRQQSHLPPRPLTNGMFRFLFEPSVLLRWVILSIALQLEVQAIWGAITRFDAVSGTEQFLALVLTVWSVVLGSLFFLGASVTGLTLARETANGNEPVLEWPDFDVAEWFIESLNVFGCLAVSLFVGVIFGQAFSLGGAGAREMGLIIGCSASLVILFPPMLLSVLEAGSPIQFASSPVWRSIHIAPAIWTRFAVAAGSLAATTILCWQLRQFDSMIGNLLATGVAAASFLMIFRMMGRLARATQQALADLENTALDSSESPVS